MRRRIDSWRVCEFDDGVVGINCCFLNRILGVGLLHVVYTITSCITFSTTRPIHRMNSLGIPSLFPPTFALPFMHQGAVTPFRRPFHIPDFVLYLFHLSTFFLKPTKRSSVQASRVRPQEPEAQNDVAEVRREVDANRRPAALSEVDPTTAPKDAVRA